MNPGYEPILLDLEKPFLLSDSMENQYFHKRILNFRTLKFTLKIISIPLYSSEREIDVYPAGLGGTCSPPCISSFTSCSPLPPNPKGREGVYPLSPFRGEGGQLVKLEIDGEELVPPCPAGYTSISRSLQYGNYQIIGNARLPESWLPEYRKKFMATSFFFDF